MFRQKRHTMKRKPLNPARKIAFSLLSMVLALALLEGGVRITEFFRPPLPVDARSLLPFQRIPEKPWQYDVTEQNHAFKILAWPSWQWQIYPTAKPTDEIRIVVLGGSAAAGYGVAPPACFPSILQNLLQQAAPNRRVRVLNLSRIGLASAQLAYLLEQSIDSLRPDLVVTVLGNNEYLDVTAAHISASRVTLGYTWARQLERHLAIARFFRPKIQPDLGDDLQHWVTGYRHNEKIQRYVQARLRRSVQKIAALAGRHQAQLMVCSAPVNYRYYKPREMFFAGAQEQPPEFIRARYAMRYGNPQIAIDLMQKRLQENPRDIPARLVMALALGQAGSDDQARLQFEQVKNDLQANANKYNYDEAQVMLATAVAATDGREACRALVEPWITVLQQNPEMNNGLIGLLYEIAGRPEFARDSLRKRLFHRYNVANPEINKTLLENDRGYNLADAVYEMSDQGISGYDYFLDYCHYNVRGHILIAHLLAPQIAELFNLPGRFPQANRALEEEFRRRQSRETDIPTLDYWAGADFDLTRLTNEIVGDTGDPLERTRPDLELAGESPLALTFVGNWFTMIGEGDAFGHAATKYYRKALAIDPDFQPAKFNLELIRQRQLRLGLSAATEGQGER